MWRGIVKKSMYLQSLKSSNTTKLITDEFRGYNRALKIGEGEFGFTANLSSREYPLLSERKKRGTVRSLISGDGMLEKGTLAWVDSGTLYVAGQATALTGLTSGEKTLVGMGSYICVFPDRKYYNSADGTDHGSMEARYVSSLEGSTVTYQACRSDGSLIGTRTLSATAPASPSGGAVWVDSSDGTYYEYSASQSGWIELTGVYTKISFTTIGQLSGFSRYDGVTISGAHFQDLNGQKILYGVGGGSGTADWICVAGIIESDYTESAGSITIERKVPQLDFVCECSNRLWGCRYGLQDGETVNEIYCCALGDFKNWRQYMGISTDSWTASVGSDGPFTGAIAYLGYPTFFKSDCIHRVVISPEGAHQLIDTACRGVKRGCGKSLTIVGDTLYYKSIDNVCAYQGGFPVSVGDAIGDGVYSDASAGAAGDCYYICMTGSAGGRELFVYDTAKGIWMREDDLNVKQFAAVGDELYAIAVKNGIVSLLALLGTTGTPESDFTWVAESGIQGYSIMGKKYVSRYAIRMSFNGTAALKIEYDSSGTWVSYGSFTMNGTGTVTVPVRPRRCDHFRVRLEGSGPVRIFSIFRTLEESTDR